MFETVKKMFKADAPKPQTQRYTKDEIMRMALDSIGSIRTVASGVNRFPGFGGTITDVKLEEMNERMPVAHRYTFMVAEDVFDNWFTVDDMNSESADETLDGKVQPVLDELKAKEVFTDALTYERVFGVGLVVGGFDDVDSTDLLREPLGETAVLRQLAAYPKPKITSVERDKNPDSPRFGEPVIYNVDRGGAKRLRVHYTRCIEFNTRHAKSVLLPIYDMLIDLDNILWGMGQTMFRYGSGFPVITTPAKTLEQLAKWNNSGMFDDICAKTHILVGEGMDVKFEGAAGRALNPRDYYEPVMENIAAMGIPKAVLSGTHAGALTGSEVNVKDYFKVVSSVQSKIEGYVRTLLLWAQRGGQFALPEKFKVNWLGGFEETEREKAETALLFEQAQEKRLAYLTKDEVRNEADYEPLPNGEGATVKQPQPFSFEQQEGDTYLVKVPKKKET